MKKQKVILFSENDKPRILINPPNLEELKANPMAVCNPNLSNVKGIPVHYWKLENGEIVPMSLEERQDACVSIEKKVKQSASKIIIENKDKVRYNAVILYSTMFILSIICSYYVSKHSLIDKLIKEIINVYNSI